MAEIAEIADLMGEDAHTRLRLFPDSSLRLPAQEVAEFDVDLERLIARMVATLSAYDGAGLAANQVGVRRRVVLVRHGEVAYALVNPRLQMSSEETYIEEEGCLSLPGVPVPVERHFSVGVQAYDPKGKELELTLEGHAARVIQHELDHLAGILIIDRAPERARRQVRAALRVSLRARSRRV